MNTIKSLEQDSNYTDSTSTSQSQRVSDFTWLTGILTVIVVFMSGCSTFSSGGLDVGSTMTGDNGMTLVYVPAGKFTMGGETGNFNSLPEHKVDLDAFWIDQTEVTNKMYSLCVEASVCLEPTMESSATHPSYYNNSEFNDFPVIFVDWNMAKTYCEWSGGRLPTEAEWEKAARGTDGRIYPWGDETPNDTLLNFDSGDDGGDTTEVGKYPNGASPYGALDMSGNVWEWVNDWYSNTYYESSPKSNPLGPDAGDVRVQRGGAWYSDSNGSFVLVTYRGNKGTPSLVNFLVGFRCAYSVR